MLQTTKQPHAKRGGKNCFIDDLTKVITFYQSVAQHTTKAGFVSLQACQKVLQDQLAASKSRTEAILAELYANGFLLAGPDQNTCRIPSRALGTRLKAYVGQQEAPKRTVLLAEADIKDIAELQRQADALPALERELEALDEKLRDLLEVQRPRLVRNIEVCKAAADHLAQVKAAFENLQNDD